MPKISSYKRIITNDFPKEDKKFVEQLASPINDSFNALYFIVNGRVDLLNNFFCTVKDVDITLDVNGVPLNTSSFSLDKQGQVLGCQVISAVNQTNSAIYPIAQPFISFAQNGQTVFINHISGLQPGQRYIIKIVAFLG